MIGALAVTTQYAISEVHPLTPKDRPAIPVGFCRGDDHLKQIAKLAGPSVIAIVSISGTFLRTWHALFASAIGKEHTVVEYHLPLQDAHALDAVDLVLCDSIAMPSVRHPHRIHYRVIAPESLQYVSTAMQSYQQP